jgi:hypothetical protein
LPDEDLRKKSETIFVEKEIIGVGARLIETTPHFLHARVARVSCYNTRKNTGKNIPNYQILYEMVQDTPNGRKIEQIAIK